ncbi:integrase core domain-containing protein [Nocardia sp. NPDC052278]|uniref:integrase core domain-containing protein n=1 Tax=unclassified Nocardia TaxID=2637762 RepID=UPI0036B051FB
MRGGARHGRPRRSRWCRTTARFRGEVLETAFAGPDPLLRHVRTRVRSPQTNGAIERFFGTLKYEHLFRGVIADGDALDMEVHRSGSSTTRSGHTRPSTTRYPAQPSPAASS